MEENNNINETSEELELSDILQIRRDKLKALCDAGENPFEKVKRKGLPKK